MSIIGDFHTHTCLCKHAEGEPQLYLETAHKRGLKYLGFSDHCPLPIGFDIESRMDFDQLDTYRQFYHDIRNNPYGIEVLYGFEIDWVVGRMDEVFDFLKDENCDYLIGSTHYVDYYPFDHPKYIGRWNNTESIQYVWDKYVDLLLDMVSTGKFDIIGHLDLPKKFEFYPKNRKYFMDGLEKVFAVAVKTDTMIEINTAGLRKPVKEIYPSLEILKLAQSLDVKITFGSDAHAPEDIAACFDEAKKLAKNAGYKEYFCIIHNDKRKSFKL